MGHAISCNLTYSYFILTNFGLKKVLFALIYQFLITKASQHNHTIWHHFNVELPTQNGQIARRLVAAHRCFGKALPALAYLLNRFAKPGYRAYQPNAAYRHWYGHKTNCPCAVFAGIY